MARKDLEPLVIAIPKALAELGATNRTRTAVRTKALAEQLVLMGYPGEVYQIAADVAAKFCYAKDTPLKGYFAFVGGWTGKYGWNNFEWFNEG